MGGVRAKWSARCAMFVMFFFFFRRKTHEDMEPNDNEGGADLLADRGLGVEEDRTVNRYDDGVVRKRYQAKHNEYHHVS